MVRSNKMINPTQSSTGTPPPGAGTTLGDVIHAGQASRALTEADWIQLAESVAAGDRLALNRLYVRTHRLIFTLLVRLTSNARIAEGLMIDLYTDLWRGMSRYNGAKGTVLGWIMNETRARATVHLRSEQRKHRREARPDEALIAIDPPNYQDLLQAKEGTRRLQLALLSLTAEERSMIELAFFAESPAELIKARLRSGLHKLWHALGAAAKGSLSSGELNACDRAEFVCAYALGALPAAHAAEIEAHTSSCRSCRRELESLRPVVESLHFWPTDVLRPPASVHERLARRVAAESGGVPALPPVLERQPEWEDVARGISCKILAADGDSHMVSLLVRLAPGGEYPPHTHAGVEELHLLDGELWIEDRKLHPGDYNRAEPRTCDKRVWSETGCTCVLVTSARDELS